MKTRLLCLFLLSLSGGCASSKRWTDLALQDARALAQAPARAEPSTWRRAALATGTVMVVAALDESVQQAVREHQSERGDAIAEAVTPFGGRYADRVMAGFFLAGVLTRNDRAKAVAFDSMISSLAASKLITPALKAATGRARPNASRNAFEFDGGSSFPSNHATQAFAVASVVQWHYPNRWVTGVSYGLATMVALSRVYDDAHWLSDVVAGAAIGAATGRFIARTNQDLRGRWLVVPTYDPSRQAVTISFRYRAKAFDAALSSERTPDVRRADSRTREPRPVP